MEHLEVQAFDFWIGEWDCTFDGGHAINTVTQEFEWRWESSPDQTTWTENWAIRYERRS